VVIDIRQFALDHMNHEKGLPVNSTVDVYRSIMWNFENKI